MKWISVKDKLPEMGKNIIFYHKENKKVMFGFALPDGVHVGGSPYPCSHWMPLPEPPEK